MKQTRRQFIKNAPTAIGAFSILSPHIALGNQSLGGIPAPSERVNVAFIGSANKGYRNRKAFLASGLCNVVALCDTHLEQDEAKESAAEHPNARQFSDYRRMFDEMADEIDAVVVSTPDHSHFPATMAAMAHGKHVWCEKPLAHTFGQCERMMDLAKRSGVVTQMGNQGHSGANYFQFKSWTEAGVVKDITKIDAYQSQGGRWNGWYKSVKGYPEQPMPEGIDWDTWCSCSPKRPYSDMLHPVAWRGWFEFGCGKLGDWAAHVIDTPHRFLKLGFPEKVTVLNREGTHPLIYPQGSTVRFHFPAREGMPPCELTWYDGPGNKPEIAPEYRDMKLEQPGADLDFESRGERPPRSHYVGRIMYSKDLVFRSVSHSEPMRIVPREKYMDMRRSLPGFRQKNSDHWKNFLLACKGEEETRSPFSVSGPLSQVLNIGMIAQRLGGELEFDREKKRFINNEAANALLDPAPRKGWEEFYRL